MARATCSLLFPRLAASSTYFATVFGVSNHIARIRLDSGHNLVHKVWIPRHSENTLRKSEGATLFAVHTVDDRFFHGVWGRHRFYSARGLWLCRCLCFFGCYLRCHIHLSRDFNNSAAATGNSALEGNFPALCVHLNHFQIFYGNAVSTHASSHAHSLNDTTSRATTTAD